MRFLHTLLALLSAASAPASGLEDADFYGQSPPVYPSPETQGSGAWARPLAEARRLVARMTPEERANVTLGFNASALNACAGNSGGVPRLGFPGLCLHDAANGVRAADMVSAYPSAVHAGAAWDRNLTYRRAWYMGREFWAKGINVLLGPNCGPLGRSPLGGRNWESFSVDPYLCGQLAAESIAGHQDAGVMANLKHFVGNEQETLRRPYHGVEAASANMDDRTLHELYAWPFMDGVRAGAASVMCSYNRANNSYGCQNSKLLNGVLKTEMAFPGFVVADWNAQHAGVASALAGLDMVMPLAGHWGVGGGGGGGAPLLLEALRNGSLPEARLADMATRVVAAWYLTGQDDPARFPGPPGHGMRPLTEAHEPVDARLRGSRDVLLEGAMAGHVLVKNERGALPFRGPLRMLSVFGYDAAAPRTKNTDSLFQLGYTSEPEMGQIPLGTEGVRFDPAARGGTIISGGRAGANSPPYISDALSALSQRAYEDGTWVNWDLDSARPEVNGASEACLVFVNAMSTEGWDRASLRDDASDALIAHVASRCGPRVVVVVHAVGPRLVDPWADHPNVTAVVLAHLPGQDSGRALVRLLWGDGGAGFSGRLPYTLARRAEDYVPYAPCNRTESDLFPQCDFDEGTLVDYRGFDARGVSPRYEFGFGLSYTTFGYSALSVDVPLSSSSSSSSSSSPSPSPPPLAGRTAVSSDPALWEVVGAVEAVVTNTGDTNRRGAEVAQLYVSIPRGDGDGEDDDDGKTPPRQLRGFEKIDLAPGESGGVRFELTMRDLAVWDVVRQAWRVRAGAYGFHVGASSRDIRLEGAVELLLPRGAGGEKGGGGGGDGGEI